ncbi:MULTISPECIES: hypothetical protein [Microbacterium]|uniref:Uncharacterized protein n=1 Tax=Microbacterium hominis TaxID=162426 RepID=A0A2K9D9F3_9MICO|nr:MULTISPECIES: hypothetical protein [Microbacterium]AUG28751.1 hypothetical protein CXR34_04195 [Microbacterium hominis]
MILPTEIRVGVVTYRVTRDPAEWQGIEHRTQTKGYYGHSQHTEAVIYLNPEASADVTRLTLWHEVLHCLDEVAMGNPNWLKLSGHPDDNDAAEETVIRMWEAPTLAVLRDNPALVTYLTA